MFFFWYSGVNSKTRSETVRVSFKSPKKEGREGVCFVLIWVRLCRLLVLYCMAWCGIGIKDSRVVNTIGCKLLFQLSCLCL